MMKNMTQQWKTAFTQGLKAGIPIALGYFAVSAAYGMAAIAQGMSVTQAVITSLTNLTSAGQFAGTSLLLCGASLTELAATTLIINARYFLMAISLANRTAEKTTLGQRMLMAYGITDEIYALAIGHNGRIPFAWFMGLMTLPVIGWSAGTGAGALASSLLPADLVNALGVAMYGMFIAIFVPAARKDRPVLYCVLLAAALSCLIAGISELRSFFGGYAIIVVTVATAALMAWRFPHMDQKNGKEDEELK